MLVLYRIMTHGSLFYGVSYLYDTCLNIEIRNISFCIFYYRLIAKLTDPKINHGKRVCQDSRVVIELNRHLSLARAAFSEKIVLISLMRHLRTLSFQVFWVPLVVI